MYRGWLVILHLYVCSKVWYATSWWTLSWPALLDGVAAVLAAVTGRLDRQVDTEALEVDDDAEDEDRGAEVHQVGQVLAVEGLPEGADLVNKL